MPRPRWRSTRFRIALATGCVLLFVALPVADLTRNPKRATGPFATLLPAQFQAQLGRGRLELRVTSLSAQHEAELESLIEKRFPGAHTDLAYRRGVLAPERWIRATQQSLVTVATLASGSVALREKALRLTGVTRNREAFERERQALVALLPPDAQVISNVVVVPDAGDINDLCREAFGAIADFQIAFERASAELRTSAHGVLDRLVEFAFDCRDATIVITGHTDAVGDADWNRKLSLLRAVAVVAYLARAGIHPGRLEARGAGSSEPIADNDTAYGRSRNRRIEFTLR